MAGILLTRITLTSTSMKRKLWNRRGIIDQTTLYDKLWYLLNEDIGLSRMDYYRFQRGHPELFVSKK